MLVRELHVVVGLVVVPSPYFGHYIWVFFLLIQIILLKIVMPILSQIGLWMLHTHFLSPFRNWRTWWSTNVSLSNYSWRLNCFVIKKTWSPQWITIVRKFSLLAHVSQSYRFIFVVIQKRWWAWMAPMQLWEQIKFVVLGMMGPLGLSKIIWFHVFRFFSCTFFYGIV